MAILDCQWNKVSMPSFPLPIIEQNAIIVQGLELHLNSNVPTGTIQLFEGQVWATSKGGHHECHLWKIKKVQMHSHVLDICHIKKNNILQILKFPLSILPFFSISTKLHTTFPNYTSVFLHWIVAPYSFFLIFMNNKVLSALF